MNKHLVIIVCFTSILLGAGVVHAGCSKDTDCKGDRICHQGLCASPTSASARPYAAAQPAPAAPLSAAVDPEQPPPGINLPAAAQAAPAAPAAPAATAAPVAGYVAAGYAPAPAAPAGAALNDERPLTWYKGYGEIGTPINFHGWAGFTGDDRKITSGFGAGFRLAGYYAAQTVHVGGFVSYATADYSAEGYSGSAEASNLSGGVALKLGGAVGSRVWMGFAMDAGFNVLFKGDCFGYNHTGITLYTGYALDVLAVGRGPFKMAITSRLGTQIEPYLRNEGADETMWQVRLGLSIGVTFGGRSS